MTVEEINLSRIDKFEYDTLNNEVLIAKYLNSNEYILYSLLMHDYYNMKGNSYIFTIYQFKPKVGFQTISNKHIEIFARHIDRIKDYDLNEYKVWWEE